MSTMIRSRIPSLTHRGEGGASAPLDAGGFSVLALDDAAPTPAGRFTAIDGIVWQPLPSAYSTLRVKAGNAADDAAGAGVREVTIVGLDGDYNEISEAVATAGASAGAATTQTFSRVHYAYVSKTGTKGSAGTNKITIEVSAGGTDVIVLGTGSGRSASSVYTVPAGYTGYLSHFSYAMASGKTGHVNLATVAADEAAAPFGQLQVLHTSGLLAAGQYHVPALDASPIKIPEKHDIYVYSIGSGSAASVRVSYSVRLVRNVV